MLGVSGHKASPLESSPSLYYQDIQSQATGDAFAASLPQYRKKKYCQVIVDICLMPCCARDQPCCREAVHWKKYPNLE
jgi:hypothetical protein